MTPADDRLILATQLGTTRSLATRVYMTDAGLQEARRWLRMPDTVKAAVSYGLAEWRAAALDAVCRELAGDDEGALEYYRGVGDLLEVVPDDLRDLDGAP